MRKKTLTYEERLNGALAEAAAAESVVTTIAEDLEKAASDKQAIATEIAYEIDRLNEQVDRLAELRDETERYVRASLSKATKIRALVSA